MTTPPLPHDTQPQLDTSDRRERTRGHLVQFWNLIFQGLRRVGLHVESFYVTVGVFLLAWVLWTEAPAGETPASS